ncbi:DUF2142 domain-containing protein [Amycolatopsis thermoflava]|uniref:DUF2142 domain-containing protein n=1 Tax=Amycolatopsis thermoflava TaxID=84480 RepID=UPI003EC12301
MSADLDETAEAVAPAGHTRRRFAADPCVLAFVLLSLVFGGVFAVITPPLWGFDEFTHVGRAYAVDHGRMLPRRIPDSLGYYGGEVPSTITDLIGHAAPNYLAPPPPPAPSVVDPGEYERLLDHPLESPPVLLGFGNTSAYSPVAYLPSAIGLRVTETLGGSVGTTLTVMRLADVLAYTALVATALRLLRAHRFKWVVFVVASLPMTVFQAGTISADAVTNALAILFSALFVRATFLRHRLGPWPTALLVASAVLLPLAKPTYVLLALLLLVVPADRLSLWRGGRALAAAAGLAGFAAWTAVSARTSESMHLMRPGETVDPGAQTDFVLGHPGEFLQVLVRTFVYQENSYFTQFFGTLGFTWVPVPATAVVCCLLAVGLALGMGDRLTAPPSRTAVTAAVVLLGVAAVFGTLYLEYSPVGYHLIAGVQGRYFIPLAIVAAAVVLRVVPLRLRLPDPRAARGTAGAVVTLMSIALALSAVKYHYVLWH